MQHHDTRARLTRLVHLDLVAEALFREGAQRLSHTGQAARLEAFADDHRQRADALIDAMAGLGLGPPEPPGGLPTLSPGNDPTQVLTELLAHEEVGTAQFSDALAWDLPAAVRVLLFRHYEEERKHQEALAEARRGLSWEDRPRA